MSGRTAPLRGGLATTVLSPRELAVLRLVAAGLTSKAIGRALAISDGTVRNHMRNGRVKLGAANSTAAVVRALQRNLIPFPDPEAS